MMANTEKTELEILDEMAFHLAHDGSITYGQYVEKWRKDVERIRAKRVEENKPFPGGQ